MSMFGEAYNNMADWLTSAWNGLPFTQKREDAAQEALKSEPILQLAAIVLAGASLIWVIKRLK